MLPPGPGSCRFSFLLSAAPALRAGGGAGLGPLEPARASRTRQWSCDRDGRPAAAAGRPRRAASPGGDLGLVARPAPGRASPRPARPRAAAGPRPPSGDPARGRARAASAAARSAASAASRSAPGRASAAATRSAPGDAGRRGRRRRAAPARTGRPRPRRPSAWRGHGLGRELPQPLLGPVRVLRRVRGDLRPVQRDHPDLPHPQPGAQHQHLREERRGGLARTAAGTAPPSRGRAPPAQITRNATSCWHSRSIRRDDVIPFAYAQTSSVTSMSGSSPPPPPRPSCAARGTPRCPVSRTASITSHTGWPSGSHSRMSGGSRNG